jgi:NAD(P)H-hydrate epimerase
MSVDNQSLRLLTAHQAKDMDRKAVEDMGISTLILMENAGRAVAVEAGKVPTNTVAVFCGKGNNGGDGFVAVRHLLTRGIKPIVFLAGKISDARNEVKTNLEILLRLKQKIIEVDANNPQAIKRRISNCGLIIDGLLGVGLSGEVRGVYKGLIDLINSSKAHTLSIDIPSGLDATTGRVLGSCVKANETITFVAKKRGMVVGEGPKYCGKVIVADIGVLL